MGFKLLGRTMFPALVSTTSPLTLLKVGLAYTFGLDVSALLTSLDPLYAKTANNLSDLAFKYTAKDNISIHGADIASAATVNLETATGDLVDVTGTTTITAITLNEGHERTVRFTGILTLTNGASLVLPSGASITTAAGDFAVFRGYAAGAVRCIGYQKASGAALVAGSGVSSIAGNTGAFTLGVGLTNATNDIQVKLPYFSASLSASQTIPNNTSTKINVNTELADSNNWYDNATNFRFTPQLVGKYRVTGHASVSGTTLTELDISIAKNGTIEDTSFNVSSSVTALSLDISRIVSFNGTTDFVEMQVLAIGTGTINVLGGTGPIRTWFEAQYVGP
jgi:hypothetical protein